MASINNPLSVAASSMNIRSVLQEYINKMLSGIDGMKVLVLDKETAGMVSMVYSQSEILQKEVFLFEKIDSNSREKMPHMKAVYFVRPTQANVNMIADELRNPKYSDYHLFFTNVIGSASMDEMAKVDDKELVKEVQEFYGDFYPVNPDTYSLNITGALTKRSSAWQTNVNRIIDGVIASLLALKKKPVIRYSAKSEVTKYLAEVVLSKIQKEKEIFDFRKQDSVLLILDRKDDPITPLLHQWTYQSMIHELLTISNNRVSLSKTAEVDPNNEFILSIDQDSFYKDNLYKNYGDLGASIKDLVETYQKKRDESSANIRTIDEMKKFIEQYPNFQKFSTTVSKHVNLMDAMSKKISDNYLMEISEIQQELACNSDHNSAYARLNEILDNPKYSNTDKLVLVLLYSIRYEDGRVWELQEKLSRCGVPPSDIALIQHLKEYAGNTQREGDLLGTKNVLTNFMNGVVKRGLQGVSNIYTQHVPLLQEILDNISKNKLKEQSYPFLTPNPPKERPNDIIVFVVGGITFEEAYNVFKFNSMNSNNGIRVVLGGTTILNCTQFLDDLHNLKLMSVR
ncbi:Sec1-like family protein [Heterostelium album PN500]|uniref:Sec1-like family protein n=1 Tax=Heterostelium pallidum (strain ATCC 26659 / Pp 5 / PN500) TaxID=670386 RepID=D3BQC3_HETP5|nr:Sec1-like family protein [Heterostelium album PN500]EFA76343.1 Sec1-like family protein [Heterostelium album PN500]|eukprot:XP_020428475.1 Sec1-like family protein [Heterostelium album PN500]